MYFQLCFQGYILSCRIQLELYTHRINKTEGFTLLSIRSICNGKAWVPKYEQYKYFIKLEFWNGMSSDRTCFHGSDTLSISIHLWIDMLPSGISE